VLFSLFYIDFFTSGANAKMHVFFTLLISGLDYFDFGPKIARSASFGAKLARRGRSKELGEGGARGTVSQEPGAMRRRGPQLGREERAFHAGGAWGEAREERRPKRGRSSEPGEGGTRSKA